jgi:hypothetical protein
MCSLSVSRCQPARYSSQAQTSAFFHALLERLATLPGVESAGAVNPLPFSGEQQLRIVQHRRSRRARRRNRPNHTRISASSAPAICKTMGIPLRGDAC